jgi:hypothetical protein
MHKPITHAGYGTPTLYGLVTALSLFFSVTGGTAMATPEPRYTTVLTSGTLSIRQYPPQLVASVTLTPDEGTRNTAFRILADYIFGKNAGNENIGMTAPVRIDDASPARSGENIGMTAPVRIDEAAGGNVHMVFYMPARYTSSTLPIPTDGRVKIAEEPARTVGVAQFSWWLTDAKFAENTEKLAAWLKTKGYTVTGKPEQNYFNAPFTPPWLRRNEVWLDVVKH